jgi:hypothetical protein
MGEELLNLDADGNVIPVAGEEGDGDLNAGSPPAGDPPVGDAGTGEDVGDDKDTPKGEGDAPPKESNLQELLNEKDVEIRELRQLTRENKRSTDALQVSFEEQAKALKDAKIIEEDPEELEKTQQARESRELYLDSILEVMRVNPKYEDIDNVVSQEHWDDMTQAWAAAYQEEHGGKLDVITRNIEAEIWGRKNPYIYMYKLIKDTHPDYIETEKGKGRKVNLKDNKNNQPSIEDIPGGGGSDKVGWTTARIDGMEEEDLNKVPADVYSSYLRGQLK